MIAVRDLAPAQLDSVLGRTSPVLKLAIALVWLVGLATTNAWLPPIVLAVVAGVAALTIGGVPPATLARAVAPLWLVALGHRRSSTRCSGPRTPTRPSATSLDLGPLRITAEALQAGVGARASGSSRSGPSGAVFALTTDSTRLVDALVQQAHVPERFAYGALAAYGAIPRFGEDLANLRQARRIRGLRGSLAPADPRRPARAGDPPRRPDGARDGCPGVRLRAAVALPGRALDRGSTSWSASGPPGP